MTSRVYKCDPMNAGVYDNDNGWMRLCLEHYLRHTARLDSEESVWLGKAGRAMTADIYVTRHRSI